MTLFNDLRTLVFLRRISRNLARIADVLEASAALDHPNSIAVNAKVRRQPKLAMITHPTVEDWNTRYRELHPPEEE